MKKCRILIFILGLCILSNLHVHADEKDNILVGAFSQQTLEGWESKKFVNETTYSLVMVDGNMVLKAGSQNSASGLIKKIRVDLEKFPVLNWRWRIENRLAGTFDEKQKSGDDYAARIYVVVSGGIAVWNTRAMNYVWAKNSLKGDVWPNAFAKKNAVMVALQSSQAPVSVWHAEKRNIHEDFKKYFGKKIRFIDAVVLMSDTDNTKKTVTAYYGDIYFSTR
ncbi:MULTISPECIES: DUF3047 domain-containing protein [Desulfobacula]|uniref:Conserved uncharacterized protein n=2 Tax=Desulfobacula TaxID=28222 RepID=K0NAY6_DESTT|nr:MULTISPECIES: DUF3047 domain-containing protein [Desulfobacula]CCK81384.1 conserved uncharacterized protein [Desulfobacula toluolica Tol2]SDU27832.1 Protein of unknown function [Desulfobacula phenolica]